MNRRDVLRGIGGLALAATLPPSAPAYAHQSTANVEDWIAQHGVPLTSTAPDAPSDDLAPFTPWIGSARVIGLGESVHGAREELTLKHRLLRFLVEDMGFRSVAWEEDWTTGLAVDEYIRSGEGDPEELVRQMSPQWQLREVADVLRWLRDFNVDRTNKVRFVGVEYYLTPVAAYDRVDAFVAATAPETLPQLREHLSAIRPATQNVFDHIQWYMTVPDKQPYIEHARQVAARVSVLPHSPDDEEFQLIVHTTQQIVSFYVHFSLPADDALVYRDAHAAENVKWWADWTGQRVLYWAAAAHTATPPQLRIFVPQASDLRYPPAGSYLRDWYGDAYVSIGFTFDHGHVSTGDGAAAEMPPAREDWFERPLRQVAWDQLAIDMRQTPTEPVQRWLAAPMKTRGLSDAGPESFMEGGAPADWFDLIVHRQEVTPAQTF
jgi:erythromycin esterase